MADNTVSTLYVRNLNERVSVNTLKSKLASVFEKWGPIVSITAHKNLKMKGQAFISFEDHDKCLKCYENLSKDNSFKIFDKKPEIKLAKTDSDAVLAKKLEESKFNEHLQQRKAAKEQREKAKAQQQSYGVTNKRKHGDVGSGATSKKAKIDLDNLPPNKVLLIQGLPDGTTNEDLVDIFGKFPGFVEVRLVSVRHVSFIEYESDEEAIVAKESIKGSINLKGKDVAVNFAKK